MNLKVTTERSGGGIYHAIVWKMMGMNWVVQSHCPHEHKTRVAAFKCGKKIGHKYEKGVIESEAKLTAKKGSK